MVDREMIDGLKNRRPTRILLFKRSCNSWSSSFSLPSIVYNSTIRTRAFNQMRKVQYLQKPGRLPDCVTSGNRDARSALGSALVLTTAHLVVDLMA